MQHRKWIIPKPRLRRIAILYGDKMREVRYYRNGKWVRTEYTDFRPIY